MAEPQQRTVAPPSAPHCRPTPLLDRRAVQALELKAIAVDDPDLGAITRRWGIRAH